MVDSELLMKISDMEKDLQTISSITIGAHLQQFAFKYNTGSEQKPVLRQAIHSRLDILYAERDRQIAQEEAIVDGVEDQILTPTVIPQSPQPQQNSSMLPILAIGALMI